MRTRCVRPAVRPAAWTPAELELDGHRTLFHPPSPLTCVIFSSLSLRAAPAPDTPKRIEGQIKLNKYVYKSICECVKPKNVTSSLCRPTKKKIKEEEAGTADGSKSGSAEDFSELKEYYKKCEGFTEKLVCDFLRNEAVNKGLTPLEVR